MSRKGESSTEMLRELVKAGGGGRSVKGRVPTVSKTNEGKELWSLEYKEPAQWSPAKMFPDLLRLGLF